MLLHSRNPSSRSSSLFAAKVIAPSCSSSHRFTAASVLFDLASLGIRSILNILFLLAVLFHLDSRLLKMTKAVFHELLLQIINCSLHGFSPTLLIPSNPSSFSFTFPLRATLKAQSPLPFLAWFFCNSGGTILQLPNYFEFPSIYLHKGTGNGIWWLFYICRRSSCGYCAWNKYLAHLAWNFRGSSWYERRFITPVLSLIIVSCGFRRFMLTLIFWGMLFCWVIVFHHCSCPSGLQFHKYAGIVWRISHGFGRLYIFLITVF